MKTKINLLLIACFACTCFAGKTFGQTENKNLPKNSQLVYGDVLAKDPEESFDVKPPVSIPTLNAFQKSFPDALNAAWYGVDKMYAVKFIKNENKHTALYNAKGKMIYLISYGSEKDLPREILETVKADFYKYNITSVANVQEGFRDVWIVNLEDERNFVTVGIESGVMEVLSDFKKPAE